MNNKFSGNIPTEIALLTNLSILCVNCVEWYISHNSTSRQSFVGKSISIHSFANRFFNWIGSIVHLVNFIYQMFLSNICSAGRWNAFTGTIPTQLGRLSKLTFMWANNHNVSSSVNFQLNRLSSSGRCNQTTARSRSSVFKKSRTRRSYLSHIHVSIVSNFRPIVPGAV